ncbi:MAG: 5'-nucleotidase C-terminal domain-containing protein [Rubrivivax sp.]|nr:5'-nucleotidase C-terminal domain-containing protein [Rubrivivax sp.]
MAWTSLFTPQHGAASARRRVGALLAGCAALALLAGCATAPREPVTVRVIAFNDFHGNLESGSLSLPWPDPDQPGRAKRLNAGGAAFLANTDIAIPGNHEFDAGKDELLRVLRGGCATVKPEDPTTSCPFGRHEGAKFKVFAANVINADGSPLFAPSVVLERGGVRIGFIGAVTRSTPSIVVPSGVAGLRFVDEAAAINAEARRLQAQGIQALVAVVHEGGDTGTPGQPLEWNDAGCPRPRGAIFEIVRQLDPAIDAVFSAHTHQGYRCVVDGRPVMQATALGRGVSVADLVIDPSTGDVDRARTQHRNLPVFNAGSDVQLRDRIVAVEAEPWASALRQSLTATAGAPIAARVAEYAAAAAPRAQKTVGRIGGSFDRSGRTDSSAGRLIADAQHQATRSPDRGGADLALMNPGGVRTDLPCRGTPPCAVTYGDIFSMQPFGNSLVVMTLSATDFKDLLESQQAPGRTSPTFMSPSASLNYRWDAKAAHGQRVQDVLIQGRPLSSFREVRLTVNSFLAEGGDGFVILRNGRNRLGGELDLDAMTQFLATSPSPDTRSRITLAE